MERVYWAPPNKLCGELMSAMRTRKQIAVLQHTQGKRMAPDAWMEDM